MKVKNIRIHNRPAYNSEVHATRDMGVGELNNCYEDAELADTIVAVGTNSLETQTNYFLNHWVPNLHGPTLERKRRSCRTSRTRRPNYYHRPSSNSHGQRLRGGGRQEQCASSGDQFGHRPRTVQRPLHLHRRQGLGSEGPHREEHAAHRYDASAALSGPGRNPGVSGSIRLRATGWRRLPDLNRRNAAAKITGLNPADIVKAAEWIGMPKEGGKRRRVMFGYEKGIIWGNDNYRTNGALVNIALATGNVGQLGGGVVRLGGHQEGYVRPDYPGPRPAPYVDQLLIHGHGGVHHIWACDHYKTTLNADQFKQVYKKRTDMVKDAMSAVPYGDRKATVDAIVAAIKGGGLFAVDVDIVPTKIGQACHVWLLGGTAGEMNLTSMNGERRLRLTERYMDPPGQAMPDCLIAARLANNLERVFREMGKADEADKFKGFDWKTEEDAFMDGYHMHAKGGEFVTYDRLRAMGTNGVQEPATAFKDGKLVGTQRLYTDGVFSSDSTARPASSTRPGAGSRRRVRGGIQRSSRSSSTTDAPTTSGRALTSTSGKTSSWIDGPIPSSR